MRPTGSGSQPFRDPGGPPPAPIGVISRRTWMRRLYMTLRTEHRTPGKVGAAVGIGVFVGCSPLWGVHFPVAYLMARLFSLNRMLVYAAAYIGNPLTVGPILFSEVQLGHILLHGSWLPITLAEVESLGFWGIFTDLMFGSLVFGLALAILLGGGAWIIARASSHHETYHDIVDAVVVRYVDASIRDAEAVRRRLLKDPMYPFLIGETVLGTGLRVLDLGCGRGAVGVLLGLFTRASEPRWYLGVDRCDRYVRAARLALGDFPGCTAQRLDLRDFDPPPADVVVLNDVLRFLPFASQDALLRRLAKALAPGARLFVREKDAAGGWRFTCSAFLDVSKILLPGHPRGGTHYRRSGDLRNALIAAGFSVREPASARVASPVWGVVEAVRRPAAVGSP